MVEIRCEEQTDFCRMFRGVAVCIPDGNCVVPGTRVTGAKRVRPLTQTGTSARWYGRNFRFEFARRKHLRLGLVTVLTRRPCDVEIHLAFAGTGQDVKRFGAATFGMGVDERRRTVYLEVLFSRTPLDDSHHFITVVRVPVPVPISISRHNWQGENGQNRYHRKRRNSTRHFRKRYSLFLSLVRALNLNLN